MARIDLAEPVAVLVTASLESPTPEELTAYFALFEGLFRSVGFFRVVLPNTNWMAGIALSSSMAWILAMIYSWVIVAKST